MPITGGYYISRYKSAEFIEAFPFFTQQFAYITAGAFAMLLAFIASIIILRGEFATVKLGKFLHYKYDREWRDTRLFAFIMGCYHAGIICMPTIVTLSFFDGREDALGIIDTVAHVLALITIYVASTIARVEDRPKVMLLGSVIYMIGMLMFAGAVSGFAQYAAVIVSISFYLSDPTMNFPYRATFMKSVDLLKVKENRSEFTYLCDIEQFNALGRVVSILAFFVMYHLLPTNVAFIVFFLVLAVLQFVNVVLCKRINRLQSIF